VPFCWFLVSSKSPPPSLSATLDSSHRKVAGPRTLAVDVCGSASMPTTWPFLSETPFAPLSFLCCLFALLRQELVASERSAEKPFFRLPDGRSSVGSAHPISVACVPWSSWQAGRAAPEAFVRVSSPHLRAFRQLLVTEVWLLWPCVFSCTPRPRHTELPWTVLPPGVSRWK